MILGLIPARGGSKAIHRKNLIDLHGIPLIQHTLIAASICELDDVICTTDDSEIAKLANDWVDVIRIPTHLAQDDSLMLPVVEHAVRAYGKKVDAVMLLQPTSPLRNSDDINSALEMWNDPWEKKPECLVSVYMGEHPKKAYVLDEAGKWKPAYPQVPYRKQADKCLVRNGAIFVTSRRLLEQGRLFDEVPMLYLMPKERSIDVDSMEDLFMARAIMKYRSEQLSKRS